VSPPWDISEILLSCTSLMLSPTLQSCVVEFSRELSWGKFSRELSWGLSEKAVSPLLHAASVGTVTSVEVLDECQSGHDRHKEPRPAL
jgi:hypothetical protein